MQQAPVPSLPVLPVNDGMAGDSWPLCSMWEAVGCTVQHASHLPSFPAWYAPRFQVTHTALVTTSILQRIRTHRPTPFLSLMVTLLMFFADTYKTVFK